MIPLVYALSLSCLIKFSFASLTDYYGGLNTVEDTHASQTYTHGNEGNTGGVLSLLGKVSSGIQSGSHGSLLYGSGASYGSGFGYSGDSSNQDGFYSAKPLNSEDVSLPTLDSTKHAFGDLNSLQTLSHGSELLSELDVNGNNHDNFESLSLDHVSSGSLQDAKELANSGEDHIKNILLSSTSGNSGTIKGAQNILNSLDSHSTLGDDISSSAHFTENKHNSNAKEHSYWNAIIQAATHGWTALFSH